MELFRVTNTLYNPGEFMTAEGQNNTYKRLTSTEKDVERILERNRPKLAPSRKECFWGFKDIYECVMYAKAEFNSSKPTYYKIEVNEKWKSPMALVNIVLKNLSDDELCSSIAQEYWNPTKVWNIVEYLFLKSTVLEVVNPPDINVITSPTYLKYVKIKNLYYLDNVEGNIMAHNFTLVGKRT